MQTKQEEKIEDLITNEADVKAEERTEDTVPAQDLDKVVEELKGMRKDRAEYKRLYEEEKEKSGVKKPETTPEDKDLDSVVTDLLNKRELVKKEELRKESLADAVKKFKSENTEFSSGNDPDGLKFSVIKREMESFKFTSAESVEDFGEILRKASLVAGTTKEPSSDSPAPNTSSPTPGGKPAGNGTVNNTMSLTDSEKLYVKANGMTEERALELKTKRPETFHKVVNG